MVVISCTADGDMIAVNACLSSKFIGDPFPLLQEQVRVHLHAKKINTEPY